MIKVMKSLVPNLSPETALIDFEHGAINAYKSEFSNARVAGCFFHLTQSTMRKVCEVGLK